MAQTSKLAAHFGLRISEIRRRRGLTQQQVARQIEISLSSMAFIETGKRWPRPQTIEKLAEVFEVPVAEFFKEPT